MKLPGIIMFDPTDEIDKPKRSGYTVFDTPPRGEPNLDNFTADSANMPMEENGMLKRKRFNVTLPNGESVWLTGNTISEAFANGLARYGQATQPRAVCSVQFARYAREWFDLYKKPKHKQTTLRTYGNLMEKHIIPYFGSMSFSDIKTDDVQRFINGLGDMAQSSARQMKILLHEVFQAAIEDGYMQKDPTASKRLSLPTKKKTREALPTEQFADVMKNIVNLEDKDAVLLALLVYTGARRGEVLGLRWEDVDTENGLLHIRRNITFRGNKPVVGTPKSKAGLREIPIIAPLRRYLDKGGTGYIIGGKEQPITESTYDRAWERIGKTIDLHGATAHVLRHTYLTMLAATDTTAKTIQAIAGHADIQTTMNRYVHKRNEDVLAAGVAFDKLTQQLTQ